MKAFFENLTLTIRLSFFLPKDGQLDTSIAQILLAFLAVFSLNLAIAAVLNMPLSALNIHGILLYFGTQAIWLFAIILCFVAFDKTKLLPTVVLIGFLSGFFQLLINLLYASLGTNYRIPFDPTISILLGVSLFGIALMRSIYHKAKVATLIALLISFVIPNWTIREFGYPQFFNQKSISDRDSAEAINIPTDALYALQNPLLARQINMLAPAAPMEQHFALISAGYANQRVFWREINQIAPILAQDPKFAGAIRLANSAHHPYDYPLMSGVNLKRAVQALSARMGPEDHLTIYLTTHGTENHLSMEFDQAGLTFLNATELSAILKPLGDRAQTIIISACQSGTFIDELAAPNRLIITAAAADKNSFGCSDDRGWTYFGRAYFAENVAKGFGPIAAFEQAQKLISKWETRDKLPPSEPQIAIGEEISAQFDNWFLQTPNP